MGQAIMARLKGMFGDSAAQDEAFLRIELDGGPERVSLPNGKEMFGVKFRVFNSGSELRPFRPVLALLKDAQGRVVYSWTIQSPRDTIPAGARIVMESAQMDIPKEATQLTLAFAD